MFRSDLPALGRSHYEMYRQELCALDVQLELPQWQDVQRTSFSFEQVTLQERAHN